MNATDTNTMSRTSSTVGSKQNGSFSQNENIQQNLSEVYTNLKSSLDALKSNSYSRASDIIQQTIQKLDSVFKSNDFQGSSSVGRA